jgi:uncharacterized protein (TIGR00255 family)
MMAHSLVVSVSAGREIGLRVLLSQSLLASFQFDVQWEGLQLVNDAKGQGGITSMTGYATREGAAPGFAWSWEVRSVNARGLDIRLRLPDGLGVLEAALRKKIGAVAARGSVNVSLRLGRVDDPGGGGVDPAALNSTLDALMQVRAVAEQRGIELAATTPAEILNLRAMNDTSGAGEMPEAEVFLADADALLDAFAQMRRAEGAALANLLSEQIDRIGALVRDARSAAGARSVAQAETFRANLQALLDATDLDEARLAQELALLAMKSDVMEELDRLDAHVTAARDLLAKGGAMGRKLDFLMQEFNREANTLCSKSQDAALTAIGLDLKLAIDQTREQVQNVE